MPERIIKNKEDCDHQYRPMRLRNSIETKLGFGCMICGDFYKDDKAFGKLNQ